MDIAALIVFGFQGVALFGIVVIFIVLLFRRLRIRENETFEKRSN